MWFSRVEFLLHSFGVFFNRSRQSWWSQWVQELEMDKPQQVNLNCPETPCMSSRSPEMCCHRHHHCTRVLTQKGLTDRQLFLGSMCCGAVPFLVGLVVEIKMNALHSTLGPTPNRLARHTTPNLTRTKHTDRQQPTRPETQALKNPTTQPDSTTNQPKNKHQKNTKKLETKIKKKLKTKKRQFFCAARK